MMLIIRRRCSDDLMIKLVQAESSLPVCITLPTPITTPDPKHSITSDPKQPQGANLVSGLPADQNTNTQHKTQGTRYTMNKTQNTRCTIDNVQNTKCTIDNVQKTKHKIHKTYKQPLVSDFPADQNASILTNTQHKIRDAQNTR